MKNIIYLHRNKINNKVYIGQTSYSLERRSRKDGSGYKGCSIFYNAILKYGWENFEHIILEENLSQEQANEREKFWIKVFQSADSNFGYNIMNGGKTFSKIKKEKRIIYCKETGQSFQTLSDAAEWAGLSRTSMNDISKQIDGKRYYAGHHPITGEKLHWCDSIDQINTDNFQRKASNAQKIINLDSLEIYNSIFEASQKTGISQTTLIKSCKSKGQRPINKQNNISYWAYLKDYEKNQIVEKKDRKKGRHGESCQVINLNTGIIFNSMKEAAEWCGLANGSRIGLCCKGSAKSAGKHPDTKEKLYWSFV